MAPVSRRKKPRRCARRRATVDLPAPAGPSIAITGGCIGRVSWETRPPGVNVLASKPMALPAAVGANLWLVAVLLPLVLSRGWVTLPGSALLAVLVMALLPVAALVVGARRRSLWLLFVGFPFLC